MPWTLKPVIRSIGTWSGKRSSILAQRKRSWDLFGQRINFCTVVYRFRKVISATEKLGVVRRLMCYTRQQKLGEHLRGSLVITLNCLHVIRRGSRFFGKRLETRRG